MRPKLAVLVDADADHAQTAAAALKASGFLVVALTSAEELVHSLERHRPDIILMDLDAPEVDAWRAVRRLGEADATCDIPVVALSAADLFSDAERLMKAGFCGSLRKPVSPTSLVAAVRYCLSNADAGEPWSDLSSF